MNAKLYKRKVDERNREYFIETSAISYFAHQVPLPENITYKDVRIMQRLFWANLLFTIVAAVLVPKKKIQFKIAFETKFTNHFLEKKGILVPLDCKCAFQ